MNKRWQVIPYIAIAIKVCGVSYAALNEGTTNIELPLPTELSHWKAFYGYAGSRSGVLVVPIERYDYIVISRLDPFLIQKGVLTHWDVGTKRFYGIIQDGEEFEITDEITKGKAYFLDEESNAFSKVITLNSSDKKGWIEEITEFLKNEELNQSAHTTEASADTSTQRNKKYMPAGVAPFDRSVPVSAPRQPPSITSTLGTCGRNRNEAKSRINRT